MGLCFFFTEYVPAAPRPAGSLSQSTHVATLYRHYMQFVRAAVWHSRVHCELMHVAECMRMSLQAWNTTGDSYSIHPGDKPWISEMYGYSYGCSTADVWHKVDFSAMLYPAYYSAGQASCLPLSWFTYVLTWSPLHALSVVKPI